jgi:hypothetical protein
MLKFGQRGRLALGLLAMLIFSGAARADTATVLGVSRNWTAYTSGTGADKVCYVMAQPRSSAPRRLKRDAVGILINDWPSKKARAEPEIVPGYKFKDGSTVTVSVGADKFTLFTTNDGGSGSAWLKGSNDEARLIEAMQKNGVARVTGITDRGTMTHDTYALAGLSDSLTRIHSACSM